MRCNREDNTKLKMAKLLEGTNNQKQQYQQI